MYIYICNVIIYIYMCIFQNALISAFSQISACGLSGQKMTPQAESGFIHMSRYSDKILVDDPGEKKCSVGDVRCFLFWFWNVIFFSGGNIHETGENTHETGENTRNEIFLNFETVNFFNTVIRLVFTPWYLNNI